MGGRGIDHIKREMHPQRERERRWFVLKRPRSDINGESESEVTVTSKLHAQRYKTKKKIRGASHERDVLNASACFFFSDHVFSRPQVLDEAFRRGGNHAEDEDASHHCKVSGCITNTPCRRIACRLRDAGRRHGAHAGMHAQSALPVC